MALCRNERVGLSSSLTWDGGANAYLDLDRRKWFVPMHFIWEESLSSVQSTPTLDFADLLSFIRSTYRKHGVLDLGMCHSNIALNRRLVASCLLAGLPVGRVPSCVRRWINSAIGLRPTRQQACQSVHTSPQCMPNITARCAQRGRFRKA
jgi:hypothetical protein